MVEEDGRWSCTETGASCPPPPRTIDSTTTDHHIAEARTAIRLGLAEMHREFGGSVALERYSTAVLSRGLVRDVFSCTVVFVRSASPVLAVPLIIAGLSALLGAEFAAQAMVVLAIALFSILIHEIGHLVAFRLLVGNDLARFWMTGLSAGLVRARSTRVREFAVTLAGPVLPLGLALAATPFLPIVAATALVLIGAGHVLSLALPGGDRDSLRRERGTTAVE